MRIIRIIFIFSIIFIFLFVTACSPSDSGEETTRIRLFEVTHSLFYAPQYVAMTQGFFQDEGLEIELTNGFGGDKTMTALLSDNADIILMGSEATIYVANQGASDLAINFAQLTQTDGSFLVSRTPIENFSWDMLKGKTLLGQRKGGMPQMVSEYVQSQNGVIPHKDVEIIQNVDYKNLGSAFASGTGDFAQLFEPIASKLELEGKGYVVASFGEESGKLPYTIYITKKSFIQENPDVVQRFTNAVYRAQKWVENHTIEEIADAIAPHFQEIDRKTMVTVLTRYKNQNSWATDPILDQDEYQNLENVMAHAGELSKKVPYDMIVNTEFAEKAIQAEKQ
ncbi:MAG: ABC transporter substrate-binding protein [Bacillaceae bacterium]|nr:ABC transporter substrate-binding protein [Bacillaceae bacterium]